MANPRFKVRRQAYFKRGITAASKITAAVGIDTTSGSVSTFSGGLTAASTATVSGCLRAGAAGTYIAGILCGSGAIKLDGIAACTASVTCFPVTGVTAAHKIFISAACISGCMALACATANAGEIIVGFNNGASEAVGAGTSTVYYLAILDK